MAKAKTLTTKTVKASKKATVSKTAASKTKRKPSKSTAKKSTAVKKSTAAKKPLPKLDETGLRNDDRRKSVAPVNDDRRRVQRRRQIDPTTCERDYNNHEIEFMHALDHYKRTSGRMFPTCSEILEVLQQLGYRKLDATQLEAESCPPQSSAASDFGPSNENEESELEEIAM